LDDLDAGKLERIGCRAFLSLETSPGNFQAWVAIADGDDKLIRRLVKSLDVDFNASCAVRIAGSPNCKEKYTPNFPEVKIVAIRSGLILKSDEMRDLLATETSSPVAAKVMSSSFNRGWPNYHRALAGAYLKQDGTGPDRSRADFFWCKWSLQRGNAPEDVAEKLLEVSSKARLELKTGNPKYVERIVEKAREGL
jgi:hypothetical protein